MPELRFNLDLIEVPIPCTVPWETMRGYSRVRYCDQCKQNVYQLSEMSREEAVNLIQKHEDMPVCVQFFRRADGTIVTRDCVALRWWRALWSGVAFGLLMFLSLLLLYRVSRDKPDQVFSKIGGGACAKKCWEPVDERPTQPE